MQAEHGHAEKMDYRVYLLAFAAFAAGIDENLIGGILPLLADGLRVSIAATGQLTSIFSLVFALCAPLLLTWTAAHERRKLLQMTLLVFAVSNLLCALSPSYPFLFAARVLSAASCSLIIVLATTIASGLVAPSHKGRAIGIVFMGISGSLVLGIPLGLVLGNGFGWRAPFVALALLAVILALLAGRLLPTMAPRIPVALRQYLRQLGQPAMLSGHGISILMIAGHFVLFAYLAAYAGEVLGISNERLGLIYLCFGVTAVGGGYLGGWLSDRCGPGRTVILLPALFSVILALLPLTAVSLWLFIPSMMVWSCLSWSISPAVQNYLIARDPRSADISVGVNTSAMHLGVALGSLLGGMVIAWGSIRWTPWVGALTVILALGCALYSTRRRRDEPVFDAA